MSETHPEIKRLNEANLARVWSMCREPGRVFLILSSDRGDIRDAATRAERRDDLRARIRSLGLGYVEMEGHFVETHAGKKEKVIEASFFVSGPVDYETHEKLDKLTHYAFNVLGQEAVLRKDGQEIMAIYANGTKENLGKFSP